ncbi:MAG: hypothetical protein L0322_18420, partial [Chloroflexi bacterium]|nr:hypothetical protein [Chloroflexota bacterium]
MGRIRWLLLLLALLLAACKRNQAPEPATFLYGHYAYVGYGTHLWVVDVTDPTGPVLVRQIGQPNQ